LFRFLLDFPGITQQSEGGSGGDLPPLDFETISKKRLIFQFRGVKNKFHHFWPLPGKNFGKIPYWLPLEKILPTTTPCPTVFINIKGTNRATSQWSQTSLMIGGSFYSWYGKVNVPL